MGAVAADVGDWGGVCRVWVMTDADLSSSVMLELNGVMSGKT